MSDITINGGLRNKRGLVILTIYSFPLGRYLLKNKIGRLNINFEGEKIILSRGENKKIIFERIKEQHPLCSMSITKIAPTALKEKVLSSGKQIPVEIIIRDLLSENDLIKNNNTFNHLLPKKVENVRLNKNSCVKVGCFISCYRYGGDKYGCYRFNVRNKIIESVVKRGCKISLVRKGTDFFIVKDDDGMEMGVYKQKKGAALNYVQISKDFLLEEEKELFFKGRWCISREAYVSMKEFGLDVYNFFHDQQEKELARALIERGIKISQPMMHKREGDILLPDIAGQIEVTKIKPVHGVGKRFKNNAHGGGVHINARLCEGFLRVNKNETKIFFVVLHEQWMEYNWVRELYEKITPSVVVIPTNFEDGWNFRVADKLKEELIGKAYI